MMRFARYLPDFGWDPIVLTVSPEALGERTDPALAADLPPGLPIVRTGLWLPADALGRLRGKPRQPQADAEAEGGGEPASRDGSAAVRAAPPSWGRRIADVLLRTPDDKAWWFWSALAPGLRIIRAQSPAVILTTGPPHSTHLVGLALSRMTRVPLVLDFRDPWARTPWGPRKQEPVSQKLIVRMERSAVRRAARVLLNTTRLRDDFAAHYGPLLASRFTLLPNGYDPELLPRAQALLRQHRPSGPRTQVSVVHVGSLYKGRDPVPVLEAIARLRRDGLPVTFRQVGNCAKVFSPEREIQRLGLEGAATFEGAVPHQTALARTAAADILLAIQPGTDLQVPGKIFEMMLFEKPIIGVVDEGATSDLIAQYRLGYTVRAGDVEGLVQAIRRVIDEGLDAGLAGRHEAMLRFNGHTLTGELARLFDEVAAASARRHRAKDL